MNGCKAVDQTMMNSICHICTEPLNPVDSMNQSRQAPVVCRSFYCQNTWSMRDKMPQPVFARYLQQQRQSIQDRLKKEQENKQRQQALQQHLVSENQTILEKHRKSNPERNIESVSLPSGPDCTTVLDQSRIEEYRQHLNQVIELAMDHPDIEDGSYAAYQNDWQNRIDSEVTLEKQPLLQQQFDKLCGECKGGCCTHGGNTGYLSPLVMRRQLDSDPTLDGDKLLRRYTSRLSEIVMKNSCINHSASGCTLPREWRSDICNGYFCESLKEYQRTLAASPEDHEQALPDILAIRRAHHNWNQDDIEADHKVVAVKRFSFDPVESYSLCPEEQD